MTVTFPQVMQRLAPLGGPLAGRSTELDLLRRAWAEAGEGEARVVMVAGEAGVGKTRLVAELAGEVDEAGAVVLVGTCPAGGAEPYHALVEALGPLPIEGRHRDAVFSALAGVVAARARRAPVLLVLDDLHRADRSTLLAVRRVVEEAGDSRLLVVATYRDAVVDRSHPLGDFLAVMLARPGVERMTLQGLSPEALEEIVGDPVTARRLWRQSEGNPVRVGELLRLDGLDQPIPPGFDDLVARRMQALTPSARSFLEAAAVAGSEFSVDVVAAAAGVSADRVPAVLKQASAAGFLVEEAAGPGATRRFVHDMVREAIGRQLDISGRVRLHLRIGRGLAKARPAPAAALIAWHFRAAAPVGGSTRALRQSARAGDRAMELLAWEAAAEHYGHALAAATGAGADVRADLLLSLGEAQRLAGESARARHAFLEAATVARARQDGTRLARAALALGQVAAVWGADHELEEMAGEARTLLGQPAPESALLPSENEFASDWLYDVLDGVTSMGAPAPPEPAAEANERGTGGVALLRARHLAMAGPEHAVDRMATATEALGLAASTGDDELAVTALGWRFLDGLELDRLDQATADQAAHAELARRLGRPRHQADVTAWSAMAAMRDGRAEDARWKAAEALALATVSDDPEADDAFLIRRWWLALEWGSAEDLAEVAQACRNRASSGPRPKTWWATVALALARGGHLDVAAEELRRVADQGLGEIVRDPGRLHALTCVAEVAWMLGDAYRAAAVGPLLEPFADRIVVPGRGVAWRGSVARACALVAASANRWDEAERHFQTALTVHRRSGASPLLARTRYERSRMLAERGRKGDRRRAADLQKKAAVAAAGLGMSLLSAEIEATAT